jgi:acetyltransferase-like isoleucine patch superfamily enzyme
LWRARVADGVELEGVVWTPGTGHLRIGARVRLLGDQAPIELYAHEAGAIELGEDVVVEAGVSIEATSSVRIGARTRLGAFCKIIDNHFHQAVGDRHARPEPVPIEIGADVVIGPHAILLPGAEIGSGVHVRPRAVVSSRLPCGHDHHIAGAP